MSTTTSAPRSLSLAQSLAVQTQVHLPGTAGRLLKQIRDLEQVAPLFVAAGLVRPVKRPKPLTVDAAGIATRAVVRPVAGGFLYAAAAARVDIAVKDNVISTRGEDSECDIDDIDFEDQSKRFQLIGVRQAYRLAERALTSGEHYDLILLDCPLLLNRSMAPQKVDERHATYRRLYEETLAEMSRFWRQHREKLFPWNASGPVIAGIAAERFGAIISASQQDLRTEEGRKHVLHAAELDEASLKRLIGARRTILGVGERRFVTGILGNSTRTAAFRMSAQTPRMEPEDVVAHGAIGLHYCAVPPGPPRLVQLIGDEPQWQSAHLDALTGTAMALTVAGNSQAWPLPLQLAMSQLAALGGFIEHYCSGVKRELKTRQIEDVWLSEIDEF